MHYIQRTIQVYVFQHKELLLVQELQSHSHAENNSLNKIRNLVCRLNRSLIQSILELSRDKYNEIPLFQIPMM
mgnify:CR=1 FL=1